MLSQPGFFDLSNRLELLSEQGDPLEKLTEAIDWKIFNRLLEKAFRKTRKSRAGRKPFPRILMFKVLVLQSLYNLSDAQTEYQIKDRLSFMRFLGLSFESRVPDEKTIWSFREGLMEANVFQTLFERFDRYLNAQGYHAEKGTMIDASVMPARIQRNSDDEKALLKAGAIPADWVKNPNKLRQKDGDARWGKKDKRSQYGYKNHVVVDVKHKLIRYAETTHAAMADVSLLMSLSGHVDNQDNDLYLDRGYTQKDYETALSEQGFCVKMPRKHNDRRGYSRESNRRIARVRIRVEHVFAGIQHVMNQRLIRCIGMRRAQAKLTLVNLVYNLRRFQQLSQGYCV